MSLSLEIYHFQAFVISEMKPLSLYSLQNVVIFLKVFLARYIKNPYTWFLPTPRVYMHVHVHMCVYLCVHVYGGRRSALGVIPQVLSTFLFETVSVTDLEVSNLARLARHPPASTSAGLGSQDWAIAPAMFMWVLGL